MSETPDLASRKICILGLGYVGLPLAIALGRHYTTVGFDISEPRIAELKAGRDSTREVEEAALKAAPHISYTTDPADIADCDTYIVTVPTPIDVSKQPDLGPLKKASETVGRALSAGDLVIFESTVYPGVTEDTCVPILEAHSGLTFNHDFTVGYSPERMNPGDKARPLHKIVKITSGSTPETADLVDRLYNSIIEAGTHRASSIRVAEAAKVVENTQRDLNIALVNELAIIFNHLGVDTGEVLDAAASKWNFLPFKPGLVGGHCIGVDPYFLIHKSQLVGYHPDIIMAGRRINDGMGVYVSGEITKLMIRKGIDIPRARILVLGLTFKENCPDIRNTKVADLVRELGDLTAGVDIHDPWVGEGQAEAELGLSLTTEPEPGAYDAVVLAVPHRCFLDMGADWVRAFGRDGAVVYDIKSALPKDAVDGQL
ncbi:nucleotide sugar dehydrogenase [Yunchengibacter salinarum]|uniref:nucleotide sugar dehydrogenase n=1 Tax=Yunchengibacter salinarum TaxID=3133399 RepID=UPI0035B685DE